MPPGSVNISTVYSDAVSASYSRVLSRILNRKSSVMFISLILIGLSIFVLPGSAASFLPSGHERIRTYGSPARRKHPGTGGKPKWPKLPTVFAGKSPKPNRLWYTGLADSGTIVETGDPSSGYGRVRLVRTRYRRRSVFQIVSMLNRTLPREITDAEITVKNAGLAKQLDYALGGAGFNIELSGPRWEGVLEAAQAAAFIMEADPLIDRVELGVRVDREIIKLLINRNAAGRLAVDPRISGQTLRILFNGEEAGTLPSTAKASPSSSTPAPVP